MKTLLSLLAGLALMASGCYGRYAHDPAKAAEAITQRLAKALDLSEAQKAQALPLVRVLVDERAAWRGEGAKAVAELKAQVSSGRFDAAALNAQSEVREKRLAASRAKAVQTLAELHAILTPEQRSKAADLLERLERRWQRRHERREKGS